MDKITDFFKEFKSRLTNPLLVSFLISWLIINWRVPVGILGYRLVELKADGYTSYADLIIKNASAWNYLYHPLIYALGYTFIFPVLRMLILAFLSFIKTKSDNWNTTIMKDYYVPMSRFVKQKERYDVLATQLQQIYIEDSKIIGENNKLKGDNLSLNNRISDINSINQILNSEKLLQDTTIKDLRNKIRIYEYESEHQNNPSIIDGDWKLNIIHKGDPGNSYTITISDSTLILPGDRHWGDIYMVSCNYRDGIIYIATYLKDFTSVILNGISDPKLTLLTLSFRQTTEQNPIIISMEGKDNYDTQYELRLLGA